MSLKDKFKNFINKLPFFGKSNLLMLDAPNSTLNQDSITYNSQTTHNVGWKQPNLDSVINYKNIKIPHIYIYIYNICTSDVANYLGKNRYSFDTEHLSFEQNYNLLNKLLDSIYYLIENPTNNRAEKEKFNNFKRNFLSQRNLNIYTKAKNPDKALKNLEGLLSYTVNYYNSVISNDKEIPEQPFSLISHIEKQSQAEQLQTEKSPSSESNSHSVNYARDRRTNFISSIKSVTQITPQTEWKKPDMESVYYYKNNKLPNLYLHTTFVEKTSAISYLGDNKYSFNIEALDQNQNISVLNLLLDNICDKLTALAGTEEKECIKYVRTLNTRITAINRYTNENPDKTIGSLENLLTSSLQYYNTMIYNKTLLEKDPLQIA